MGQAGEGAGQGAILRQECRVGYTSQPLSKLSFPFTLQV